ncbi:hypothetical protein Z517_03554 [Fonsecaea pedrosoi CBS 271.37]|uniref:Ketoreductase domain-containing protein n=1 Tax=Fonsecaea pedrosoi CBS 271.37 TaxID=1442368 RepID=A0A0D2HIK8_9EURO|nr:uncharacterized protein Z517_03554 [Fonsecaea pedrosoi CBS 271.37]KIW84304.1 hypothetical protein Z517_03554 [Fonsecaea pedrosoi CBS 271.37]
MPAQKREGAVAPGVAFVTGGARGLGNAVAVAFAREGARGVVIVDIQDDATMDEGKKAVEAYGTECLAIRADVTQEQAVVKAVAEAVSKFGRIDYAANFAGIVVSGAMYDLSLEGWEKVIAVNSTGVFLSMKHELKQMMEQESLEVESDRPPQKGSVVNCASITSIQASAGTGGYAASKHAVLGVTKAAALDARRHGIRVNCVSPGFLRTQLVAGIIKEGGEKSAEKFQASEARQGRPARFSEIGDAVVLLSTPRMSLVNGHNLVCDG